MVKAGVRGMLTDLQSVLLQSRRIVVGQKGCVIGEVGITARKELQTLLKTKLHLYLKVAVKS